MASQTHLSDKTEQMSQLDSLEAQIHSASEIESYTALTTLAQQHTNDSARSLIDAFLDSHWRDTKLAIIKALGRNGSERAVAFLLELTRNQEDLGLVQEVYLALGDSKDPLAATYLLENLKSAPVYMKPWVVTALTRIPDFRANAELKQFITNNGASEHPLLLRNCVVALAEMKDVSVLNDLINMLRERIQTHKHQIDETSITLLSAIAKLSRDPEELGEFERFFGSEMLHEQVFKQCQTQVIFRKQWTLEDYLGKIFFNEDFHPSLPLELNSYNEEDVLEALLLFKNEEKHFQSFCTVLKFFTKSDALLGRLVEWDHLTDTNLGYLISHCMLHRNDAVAALCAKTFEQRIRDHLNAEATAPLFSVWLKATLCIEVEPLRKLFALFEAQQNTSSWHAQNKIELINAFISAALIFHQGSTWSKKQIALIAQLLEEEIHESVLGRWIRALGEANLTILKLSPAIVNKIKNSPALRSSALLMMSRMNEHQYNQLLTTLFECSDTHDQNLSAFLKACSKLKIHDKNLPTDEIVETALSSKKTEDIQAALSFLARHPRQQFLNAINERCKPETSNAEVVVQAIVTARSYRSETSVNVLTQCLHSTLRVVTGRALDTLLAIDSNAARSTVIRYLTENQTDFYIVDKVLRSIKLPKGGDEATATLLDQTLVSTHDSPLHEELRQLANSLRNGLSTTPSLLPSTDVIKQLDEFLSGKIDGFLKLPDPIKASLRSAEIPHMQPDLFEGSVDKSASVVQYCKAIDLTLEKEFGQKTLFPKLEQQLHLFQNILRKTELDQESVNTGFVMRQLGIEHLFEPHTFPALKMKMLARSILTGKIIRERTQVIDGLKAWAVLLLLFSGHDFLWGKPQSPEARLKFQTLSQKLVSLQDLRNPAAHRQTMLTLAPLSEIRKEVFSVLNTIQTLF